MGDATLPDIALDSGVLDELNTPATRILLDTIDSLRELRVGEIVNLPQIIVVGDQSSGKSSVLEAISRVRFPAHGGLCTRFATELVLRRATESKIAVRIDPAGLGSSQNFHRTSFSEDALPEIINEAREKMGISSDTSSDFSRDVLRIEISKPDVYPLTLVDLPGIFHSETQDQTTEDIKTVQDLAKRYMTQPNSIILIVVSANHNLANQYIAGEARKQDPGRERTLGVITKPDLLVAGSHDEKMCLKLVKSLEKFHGLKYGWHVLRNRPEGHEQMSADDRDFEEDIFFRQGAWSDIDPTSCGINHLRKKLSRVLLKHIQKALPSLVKEIESNLSTRQQALDQLGKPRLEPNDQREYLIEIAEKFQRLAQDGVQGRYGDGFFGNLYDARETRKLRSLLRRLNRAFHVTMLTKGVDRRIEREDDEGIPLNDGGISWSRNGSNVPEYLEEFVGFFDTFPEPTTVYESTLREELEKLAAANQGTEFPGLPNGNLGFQLFKMQAQPWGGIADFYLDKVMEFARSFVEELFIHIIGRDEQTTNAILAFCVGEFFKDKRKVLKDKLQEIIRPYASAYGPPSDAEFHTRLLSRTIGREAGRVASLLEDLFPAAFTSNEGNNGLTYRKVEKAISGAEMNRANEFGVDQVIDMAMTHFEISLGTFAHNVVNLAAENCLISDLSKILTPSIVIRMSEARLKELASESEDVQSERRKLQYEVEILSSGLWKCREPRLHGRTVLPGASVTTPPSTPSRQSPSSRSS